MRSIDHHTWGGKLARGYMPNVDNTSMSAPDLNLRVVWIRRRYWSGTKRVCKSSRRIKREQKIRFHRIGWRLRIGSNGTRDMLHIVIRGIGATMLKYLLAKINWGWQAIYSESRTCLRCLGIGRKSEQLLRNITHLDIWSARIQNLQNRSTNVLKYM